MGLRVETDDRFKDAEVVHQLNERDEGGQRQKVRDDHVPDLLPPAGPVDAGRFQRVCTHGLEACVVDDEGKGGRRPHTVDHQHGPHHASIGLDRQIGIIGKPSERRANHAARVHHPEQDQTTDQRCDDVGQQREKDQRAAQYSGSTVDRDRDDKAKDHGEWRDNRRVGQGKSKRLVEGQVHQVADEIPQTITAVPKLAELLNRKVIAVFVNLQAREPAQRFSLAQGGGGLLIDGGGGLAAEGPAVFDLNDHLFVLDVERLHDDRNGREENEQKHRSG